MGIPVICCGEAWIRNKKITFDPKNKIEYIKFLNMNLKNAKIIQKVKLKKHYSSLIFIFYKND